MWEDLFDLLAQLFIGTGTRTTAEASPGPPVDAGTALVLLGLGMLVAGIVLLFVSHVSHVMAALIAGGGLVLFLTGLRRAGR